MKGGGGGCQSQGVLFWCFFFLQGGRRKTGLGLVHFAHMLNVRFFRGMWGAGIERTVDSYTWREAWQRLVCRDLGPGHTVAIHVGEWCTGVQTVTEKGKGAVV